MRDLDKTVAYDLRDLSDEQLKELLNWLIKNDKTWSCLTPIHLRNEVVYYSEEEKQWLFYGSNANVVNALTLFEPQFKQGDKVLWTDDKESWDIGFFIAEYKDSIIVESYDCLYFAIEVKPCEPQKKWYIIGRGVDAYYSVLSEDEVLWSRAEGKRVEEITNIEFVKYLKVNAN